MQDPNKMKNNLQLADGKVQSSTRITEWENEPSLLRLKEDLQISQATHDTMVAKVQGWLALRDPKKPKRERGSQENRSQIQPKLVRKQAEWRYSALSEPFLSTEKAVKVDPSTWEDTLAAQQNELVLNHQLRNQMDWVTFIDEFVRTTTDEGTCFIKVGWKRHTVKEKVQVPQWTYYEVSSQEEVDMLDQAIQLKQSNPNGYMDLPEELREAAEFSMENGQPVTAAITGYAVVEQEKIITNRPTADFIDIENVFLDPNAEGDVDKAGFGIISFETSKAEMLQDGRYKNLDRVNWSSNSPQMSDGHSTRVDETMQFTDTLRKRVVAYEYWGFLDIHGDDALVPIVATWIGDVLVRMEENPFPDKKIPIVAVPYMPIKKSIAGEPDAELLEDNQSILGALTRGTIDLMGRSANAQTGYAKGMLDAVNKKRMQSGLDYEFNTNITPAMGVHQHKYPELPQSALTMINLQNAEAESLTGVKAFSGGMSGNAYGDVAAGIRGMLDAASKREMGILRRMANGVKKIAEKFASMNAAFLSEEETIRITNTQFVKVRREDLAGKFDIKIDISTAEVDEAKAKDLAFMLQTMGNNMDFSMVQLILAEIATLKRMPELARKIMEFKPAPDPITEKLRELEVAKAEADIAEVESRIHLNQAKARAAVSNADKADLDFVEQESGTKHARELQRQSAQAESNMDLELTKRILEPDETGSKMKDVTDAMQFKQISKLMSAAQ